MGHLFCIKTFANANTYVNSQYPLLLFPFDYLGALSI